MFKLRKEYIKKNLKGTLRMVELKDCLQVDEFFQSDSAFQIYFLKITPDQKMCV